MRFLYTIIFCSLVFSQELNNLSKENEYQFNKHKISVKSFTSNYIFMTLNYSLIRGYDEEISLSDFVKLYGDNELIEYIDSKESIIINSTKKKWIYFIFGTSLLVFAQDHNGRVIEEVRLPSILSFLLFGYHHKLTQVNNNDLLSLRQVNDLVDLYNQRLLDEINP